MTFRVGQKVVCVNDAARPGYSKRGPYPVKGRVYTIRDFVINRNGENAVRLIEVNRGELDGFGFWTWRFRPVKTTDISIFEAMLRPTKQEEKVK